jgi:glycogen debranching enzyme
MTTAAPLLYPHMWSWDAAFIAIGLSHVSAARAIVELDTLLTAQWRNGMIPHIVFSPVADSYFPDADRWDTARLAAAAPADPETSGICQPPVHAIAVQRILESAGRHGAEEQAAGFLDRAWPRLLAWHRWLASARDPGRHGRVTIHHGWESGMDNSPRWDGPYARVRVGPDLPPYERRDREHVAAAQRPSDVEYDRYLWLIEEMKKVGYDDERLREVCSFAVEDVFFSAVLCVASDVLVEIGERHGRPDVEVAEVREIADRFRAGVVASIDPSTGLARDRDLRTGEWLASETIAGFAPLLCGEVDAARQQTLLDLLDSARWSGHPGLLAAVPPSTSPASPEFRQREYWRGPQWPVLTWLFSWAFDRNGWPDHAARLRKEGLGQLAGGEFGEYYDPFTGEALGSSHQSWTAAVALDWLHHE